MAADDISFLVTGALGCIGAWVLRTLAEDGVRAVGLDLDSDGPRLRAAVNEDHRDRLKLVTGDVRDPVQLEQVMREHAVTHVIHLAALQVPFCAADPILGAQVNVVGTVAVFEAAKAAGVERIAYASSVAAYDSADSGAASSGELGGRAATLYGVYKRANEGTATVYWNDHGLPSIGVRPYVVYGPGRDQGLTSAPTLAMRAAAEGKPFHIGYGGRTTLQYVADAARDIVLAARATETGARVVNLPGTVVSMADVVAAIEAAAPDVAGAITYDDIQLPFPVEVEVDRGAFAPGPPTPLAEGVRATVQRFRELVA